MPALDSLPDSESLIRNFGMIHPSVIDRAHTENWTVQKLRTYIASCCFANGETGEFHASERTIASLAGVPRGTLQNYLGNFLAQRLVLDNGNHGRVRSYIITAYTVGQPQKAAITQSSPPSYPKSSQSTKNIGQSPERVTSQSSISNYPKSSRHRPIASENRATLQPAPHGRLDPEIPKTSDALTEIGYHADCCSHIR